MKYKEFKTSNSVYVIIPTLRIQLIATAPGVALFLDTPTEVSNVCVVKTPMAPPKKCYREDLKS